MVRADSRAHAPFRSKSHAKLKRQGQIKVRSMQTPRKSKPELVLGIMSGTSVDCVDCALCTISNKRVTLVRHWQVQFPQQLRNRILAAAHGHATSWEVAVLHHDLGRFYAGAVLSGIGRDRPVAIGLHGQTVFHSPGKVSSATFQLGEAAWIAEELRVPVVCNFRAADLAAGGQGAPLATLFHKIAFASKRRVVCVNNLGGISNVTLLDWRSGSSPRIVAFDTGPANLLLDTAMRHFTSGKKPFDFDGKWAANGKVDEVILGRWIKHPYFALPPPKSTGREMFGEKFWRNALKTMKTRHLSKYDLLATLTEYTARSIALNYKLHLGAKPDVVILCGGGAKNPTLVRRIAQNLVDSFGPVDVVTSDSLGWPCQAVEPAAFALLAWRRIHRMPGNVPETTGARRAAVLGQLAVA